GTTTGVPVNAARFTDGPTSGTRASAHATPPTVAARIAGRVSTTVIRRDCADPRPMVASRASVISRDRALSTRVSASTSRLRPAAAAAPWANVTNPPCGSGAPAIPASTCERRVTREPGTARWAMATSAAASRFWPSTPIAVAGGACAPSAHCGSTANWPPDVTPTKLPRRPATRTRTVRPATYRLDPLRRRSLAAGETSTGTRAAVPGAPGRASAAAGNRGSGVAAVSAAELRGATSATGRLWPSPDVPVVTETVTARWTPGTPARARCAAGVIPGPTAGAVMVASAPAACQDAATLASATALRAIPANAATANASTRANAGSTPAC